jgi:quinoprotein glucose dehydrogenase
MCFATRGCRARRFCGIATFTVLALSVVASASPKDNPKAYTTWSTYLGSADASHYTALRQIDRSNVSKLQVAWSYDSGSEQPYAFNPIVVGRTMYVLAKNSSIVALDATTGKELWTYHSRSLGQRVEGHRGINF